MPFAVRDVAGWDSDANRASVVYPLKFMKTSQPPPLLRAFPLD